MKHLHPLILIVIVTFLSACSTGFGLLPSKSDPQEDNSADASAKEISKPRLKDFDPEKDTLFDLMVAEIAGQRDQLNITLLNYIQQAHMTRDPEVIKRAINAAQYTKDIEAIKEMAFLWAEAEPDNASPHQLLAYQYFYAKDYAAAAKKLDTILALDEDARIDALALGSQSLPEADKREILKHFQALFERYPENHQLPYGIAFMHKQLNEFELGLQALEPIFKLAPKYSAASVLKTNLLYETGKRQEAIKFAGTAFKKFPGDHNLGRIYASMLVENKQFNEAESVFKSLIDRYPQASSLKLSLGLVMLENNKINQAKDVFYELLKDDLHPNEVNFYLGRIADQENHIDQAIAHYMKIEESTNYDTAIERASFLLTQQNKVNEMIDYLSSLREQDPGRLKKLWLLELKLLSMSKNKERLKSSLDQAIEAFPEEDQFLYARAMNRESEGNLAGMEEDLRIILEIKPDHAVALNALGYTLADKTDRYQEAFTLIDKALNLDPDNPAIQDSMGWVLFKLNKREEALYFLLKAFQSYQDGEVAAHLGEVLLSLNQKTEAYNIWSNVLAKYPAHPVLLDTIQRLAPELLEQLPASDVQEDKKPESPADVISDKPDDSL